MKLQPGDAVLVTGASPGGSRPGGSPGGAPGHGSPSGQRLARQGSGITRRRLRHGLAPPRSRRVEGDVLDAASTGPGHGGCRAVVHAAGQAVRLGPRREFFDRQRQGDGERRRRLPGRRGGAARAPRLADRPRPAAHGGAVDEETPVDAAAADAYTASRLAGERIAARRTGRPGGDHGRSGRDLGAGRPDDPPAPRRAAAARQDGPDRRRAQPARPVARRQPRRGRHGGAGSRRRRAGSTTSPTARRSPPARRSTRSPRRSGCRRRGGPLPFGLVYAAAALLEGLARLTGRRGSAADDPLRRAPGRLRLPLRHRQGPAGARLPAVVSFRDGVDALAAVAALPADTLRRRAHG